MPKAEVWRDDVCSFLKRKKITTTFCTVTKPVCFRRLIESSIVKNDTNCCQHFKLHYGAEVTEDPKAPDGYWMVEWTSTPYTDQATGNLVADALYLNTVDYAPKWWTRSVQTTKVKINNVVLADVKMIEI